MREPPRRYYAAGPAKDAAPKAAASRDAEDRYPRDRDYERDDLRDRDEIDDYDDYEEREFDVVLASLRKTLERVAEKLPFEERRKIVAETDELEAKAEGAKPAKAASNAAEHVSPTPGKGPRSPPDTG